VLLVRSDSSHTENPQNCLSKNLCFAGIIVIDMNYTEIN
jgi:hypothetical protein